jgi:hypothetical protein
MHNLFVCKPKPCSLCLGTWDYLGLNRYTIYFVHQGQESKPMLMDTGVANIPDDNYATASSQWLQVRRQANAERIFRVAVYCIELLFIILHFLELICIKIITEIVIWGTGWQCWSRHCAISRKVAASFPIAVSEICHRHNPSGRTIALGSTQPLTALRIGRLCER